MSMQWNLGGWLGAQFGSTCWILVAGLLALQHDRGVAVTVLVLFAVPNLIGLRLWASRDRLSPVNASRTLITAAGLFGLAAVYVLDSGGVWEVIQVGGRTSAGMAYGTILVVVAGLLFLFHRLR
jgi:hypothetical protein